jgi:hypothetical protein
MDRAKTISMRAILMDPDIFGDLYFSRRQWKELRDKERNRTFGKLINGDIVEYTELVPIKDLSNNIVLRLYDDVVYVGRGVFHHFLDEKERLEW